MGLAAELRKGRWFWYTCGVGGQVKGEEMTKRIHHIYSAVLCGFLIVGLIASSGCLYFHADVLARQWTKTEICPTLLPNCAQLHAFYTVDTMGKGNVSWGRHWDELLVLVPSSILLDALTLPINVPVCLFSAWEYEPFELTIKSSAKDLLAADNSLFVSGEWDAFIFKTNPHQTYMSPHFKFLTFHIEHGRLILPNANRYRANSDWIFDKTTARIQKEDTARITYDDSRQIKVRFNLTSNNLEANSIDYLYYDSKTQTYIHDIPEYPDNRHLSPSGTFTILLSPDFKGEISFEGKRYVIDKTKAENQLIVEED